MRVEDKNEAHKEVSPASKPGPWKPQTCSVSQPGILANVAMHLACSLDRYLGRGQRCSQS